MKKQATGTSLRQITLCNKSFKRAKNLYVVFPELHLKGKWLAESGFRAGHVVDIVCNQGRLVITIAKEQRFVLHHA